MIKTIEPKEHYYRCGKCKRVVIVFLAAQVICFRCGRVMKALEHEPETRA